VIDYAQAETQKHPARSTIPLCSTTGACGLLPVPLAVCAAVDVVC
jgi:hypothetical protein